MNLETLITFDYATLDEYSVADLVASAAAFRRSVATVPRLKPMVYRHPQDSGVSRHDITKMVHQPEFSDHLFMYNGNCIQDDIGTTDTRAGGGNGAIRVHRSDVQPPFQWSRRGFKELAESLRDSTGPRVLPIVTGTYNKNRRPVAAEAGSIAKSIVKACVAASMAELPAVFVSVDDRKTVFSATGAYAVHASGAVLRTGPGDWVLGTAIFSPIYEQPNNKWMLDMVTALIDAFLEPLSSPVARPTPTLSMPTPISRPDHLSDKFEESLQGAIEGAADITFQWENFTLYRDTVKLRLYAYDPSDRNTDIEQLVRFAKNSVVLYNGDVLRDGSNTNNVTAIPRTTSVVRPLRADAGLEINANAWIDRAHSTAGQSVTVLPLITTDGRGGLPSAEEIVLSIIKAFTFANVQQREYVYINVNSFLIATEQEFKWEPAMKSDLLEKYETFSFYHLNGTEIFRSLVHTLSDPLDAELLVDGTFRPLSSMDSGPVRVVGGSQGTTTTITTFLGLVGVTLACTIAGSWIYSP